MSEISEAPQVEADPPAQEFDFDPKGIDLIVEAAASRLAEFAQAGGNLPMKPDGITFDVGRAVENNRGKTEAAGMTSALDLVFKRRDGRSWSEVIEAKAAESGAPSDNSSSQ
jgi:hypothetical protein